VVRAATFSSYFFAGGWLVAEPRMDGIILKTFQIHAGVWGAVLAESLRLEGIQPFDGDPAVTVAHAASRSTATGKD
jgi:hypothetical protein